MVGSRGMRLHAVSGFKHLLVDSFGTWGLRMFTPITPIMWSLPPKLNLGWVCLAGWLCNKNITGTTGKRSRSLGGRNHSRFPIAFQSNRSFQEVRQSIEGYQRHSLRFPITSRIRLEGGAVSLRIPMPPSNPVPLLKIRLIIMAAGFIRIPVSWIFTCAPLLPTKASLPMVAEPFT